MVNSLIIAIDPKALNYYSSFREFNKFQEITKIDLSLNRFSFYLQKHVLKIEEETTLKKILFEGINTENIIFNYN